VLARLRRRHDEPRRCDAETSSSPPSADFAKLAPPTLAADDGGARRTTPPCADACVLARLRRRHDEPRRCDEATSSSPPSADPATLAPTTLAADDGGARRTDSFPPHAGCYMSVVLSRIPELWTAPEFKSVIETTKNVYSATHVDCSDIWTHYFLVKEDKQWKVATVFSSTTRFLSDLQFSFFGEGSRTRNNRMIGKGVFYRTRHSNLVRTRFLYLHTLDPDDLEPPTLPSQFRNLVVSPSRTASETSSRAGDNNRLFRLAIGEPHDDDHAHTPAEEYLPNPSTVNNQYCLW